MNYEYWSKTTRPKFVGLDTQGRKITAHARCDGRGGKWKAFVEYRLWISEGDHVSRGYAKQSNYSFKSSAKAMEKAAKWLEEVTDASGHRK